MVWWVGGFEALDVRPKIRQEMRKKMKRNVSRNCDETPQSHRPG